MVKKKDKNYKNGNNPPLFATVMTRQYCQLGNSRQEDANVRVGE
jgi:uncharacterized UBP type Zn finger protein